MRHRNIVIAIILLVLLSPFAFSGIAYAKTGVGVTPTVFDSTILKKNVSLAPITVNSTGDVPEVVVVYPVGLTQNEDGSAVFLDTPDQVAKWKKIFIITPSQFDLDPGQRTTVNVAINLPPGLSGGLYGGITVKAVPKSEVASGKPLNLSSAAAVGCVVELAMPDGVIDGKLVGMVISEVPADKAFTPEEQKTLDAKKQLPYRLNLAPVLQNTGTRHYKPDKGFVRVLTAKGQEIGRPDITPGQNVLPGCKRDLRCIWPILNPLPDGNYYAEAHVWIPGGKELVYGEWFAMRDGRLARRAGKILDEKPGKILPNTPMTMQILAEDTGALPYQPTLTATVLDKDKTKEIINSKDIAITSDALNPNQQKWFPLYSNKTLAKGEYTLRVHMAYKGEYSTYQDANLDNRDFLILVGKKPSWWTYFWNWLLDNWWWIVLIIAAIIIAGLFYWQHQHNKKKMERLTYRGMPGMPMMAPPPRGRPPSSSSKRRQ
jgi:hypothetical protein